MNEIRKSKMKPRKLAPETHPRLWSLLASGVVKAEGETFVGLAADGQWVTLGRVENPGHVEMFLRFKPGPSDW